MLDILFNCNNLGESPWTTTLVFHWWRQLCFWSSLTNPATSTTRIFFDPVFPFILYTAARWKSMNNNTWSGSSIYDYLLPSYENVTTGHKPLHVLGPQHCWPRFAVSLWLTLVYNLTPTWSPEPCQEWVPERRAGYDPTEPEENCRAWTLGPLSTTWEILNKVRELIKWWTCLSCTWLIVSPLQHPRVPQPHQEGSMSAARKKFWAQVCEAQNKIITIEIEAFNKLTLFFLFYFVHDAYKVYLSCKIASIILLTATLLPLINCTPSVSWITYPTFKSSPNTLLPQIILFLNFKLPFYICIHLLKYFTTHDIQQHCFYYGALGTMWYQRLNEVWMPSALDAAVSLQLLYYSYT